MTKVLVIDASVALKWVLPENDSDAAERLLDLDARLHAPAFIFMEMANALWFQMRAGKLGRAAVAGCLRDLRAAPLELWAGEEPLPSATDWAYELDHAVYDCAYLALALHLDGTYLTADHRFWQKAASHNDLEGRVQRLVDLD